MSAARLILAWTAAVFAVCLLCASVLYVGSQTPLVVPPTELDDIETVVIGSSLTQAAIPAFESGNGGLLDNRRPYELLVVVAMREDQALAILDRVVELGVSTVIVEANDFVYDRVDKAWSDRVTKALGQMFRRGLALLKGSHKADLAFREGEFPKIGETMNAGRTHCKPKSRIVVKDGNAGLAEMIDRARDKAIEVILFLPPSSECYDNGAKGAVRAINVQAGLLADDLGAPIWRPDGPWANDLFRDPGHLNIRGRERFLHEFSTWLRARDQTAGLAQAGPAIPIVPGHDVGSQAVAVARPGAIETAAAGEP